MKILFITDNFPPEVNAPATRTYEHCKKWVDMGVEVTVITCAPNFPQGKVYQGYNNKLLQKETIDGITVIRVWSYITSNKGTIKRTLDYMSFAFSAFWASLFKKADVIIATSPQFFTTWTACALSALKKTPWVFELRDLWPESIKAVGALKEGFIYNMLEKVELLLYENTNCIIPNTKAFKQNLIKRGVDKAKIHVISNGVNMDLLFPTEKNRTLLADLGLKGKFIVGYLGTHGLAHNLDFILSCAASINDLDIAFLFIGDGAEKENLMKKAERLSLKNVTFLDPIPKEQVPLYLSTFDVALVPLKKSKTFKTVIPSKIFEAAAMQKPVLLGVEGQAKRLIEDFNVGLCFEPENKVDFIQKLKILNTDKTLYSKLSINGATFAKAFSRDELARKMLKEIEKLN